MLMNNHEPLLTASRWMITRNTTGRCLVFTEDICRSYRPPAVVASSTPSLWLSIRCWRHSRCWYHGITQFLQITNHASSLLSQRPPSVAHPHHVQSPSYQLGPLCSPPLTSMVYKLFSATELILTGCFPDRLLWILMCAVGQVHFTQLRINR